jgi:hypothetical protein
VAAPIGVVELDLDSGRRTVAGAVRGAVSRLALRADGRRIAVADGSGVLVLAGGRARRILGDRSMVSGLCWAGARLAVLRPSVNGATLLAPDGRVRHTISPFPGTCIGTANAIYGAEAFASTLHVLDAASGVDRTIRLPGPAWDLTTIGAVP